MVVVTRPRVTPAARARRRSLRNGGPCVFRGTMCLKHVSLACVFRGEHVSLACVSRSEPVSLACVFREDHVFLGHKSLYFKELQDLRRVGVCSAPESPRGPAAGARSVPQGRKGLDPSVSGVSSKGVRLARARSRSGGACVFRPEPVSQACVFPTGACVSRREHVFFGRSMCLSGGSMCLSAGRVTGRGRGGCRGCRANRRGRGPGGRGRPGGPGGIRGRRGLRSRRASASSRRGR